jgi:hypothetical protein
MKDGNQVDEKPSSKFLARIVDRIKNIRQTLEARESTISLNLGRTSENSVPLVDQHQPNEPMTVPSSDTLLHTTTKTSAEEASAPPLPELVPGSYYSFDFLVEITNKGASYIGHPCRAIRHVVDGRHVTSWGADIKYLAPTEAIARIAWIDDPEKGLSQRELSIPEHLIGAEGIIGGKRCIFERILDLGKNVVVYSIYFHEQQFRVAYGFRRNMFIMKPDMPLAVGK